MGSNLAISGLFLLLPWASWSTALVDPLLLQVPKLQPSTEGPVLPWSSSLPRVLSLPKPRAPPHSREKREGPEELCRNPPKPEHFPAAEQSPWKSLLRLGPPTHMKAAFFWANYTGCSEPPGRIRAAKADIKGLPTLIYRAKTEQSTGDLSLLPALAAWEECWRYLSSQDPPSEDKWGRGGEFLFAWQAPSRLRQRAGAGPCRTSCGPSKAF